MTNDANIRLECLKPAERWAQPTGEEVREVLRLAGFSGSKAAKALGLGAKGDRTIRRWIGEDTPIPCGMGDPVRPGRAGRDLERGLTPRERF